jgi:DNA invertase Pin-like site-specific DNA recombinase
VTTSGPSTDADGQQPGRRVRAARRRVDPALLERRRAELAALEAWAAEHEALRSELARGGQRRARVRRVLRAATAAVADACVRAVQAGMPISEVASTAGVTRQAVYDWLAQAGAANGERRGR